MNATDGEPAIIADNVNPFHGQSIEKQVQCLTNAINVVSLHFIPFQWIHLIGYVDKTTEAMRIIHTADWHLGRIFHGIHLTEDQRCVLFDQLIPLVRESRPNVLLISGDIYDRAVPPSEAVNLLDEFLSTIVLDLKVPVIIIPGNHDDPNRLKFGSRIMAGKGLYVVGKCITTKITLLDQYGQVNVYAVPYMEPVVVRQQMDSRLRGNDGGIGITNANNAMRVITDRIRKTKRDGNRSILMAHTFVTNGEKCDSERLLSVGGADKVDSRCFEGFNYTALGHLHRPQKVRTETSGSEQTTHYSGSLLKYSFSEASHHKSVNLVEMDAKGHCTTESVPLTPRRDVRCIEGYMRDILLGPQNGENSDDYIEVTLLDREPILQPMDKLRSIYPNVLNIRRPQYELSGDHSRISGDVRKLDDLELFRAFFREIDGNALTKEQADAFSAIVDEFDRRSREENR